MANREPRLTIRNSISILSHSTSALSSSYNTSIHFLSRLSKHQARLHHAGRNATAAAAKSPAGALSCKPASDKWQSDSNFRGISGVETGQGLVYS
ncbi:hypothetical protein SNOG_12965 [Parastagonospora nodorum SN15]|uniref:Uncharacterized protein n=1 Tax=Phaeosphaeria nodorum (strain SN15 / ATCC MYA-4574 / FGSC 10173) TaxID=321614 RepID=Q0U5J9_PHANO|nr:hypothetical protein SNOG_12965 [Parastagonospora nodorum SN15]EAT79765.1 hypothetical protein SNOG_12965 [Parastagonospora nodorum SN15]